MFHLFTVHETKENQLGVFACRVLGVQHGDTILLVRPCLNPACPDLGFRKVKQDALDHPSFKDKRALVDINPVCAQELYNKLQHDTLEETDSLFSGVWFNEIAKVTELDRYQNKIFS
jgi:hypothetical protein